MTYDDLTEQEKEDYTAVETQVRGITSALGRVFNDADMPKLVNFYTGRVVPIKAQLDAGGGPPKTTALAGSTAISHENLTAILTFLNGIQTDLTTNIDLLQKAVGINV